MIKGIEHI